MILTAEDSAYAITSASKHKEEARKFLDFLFKPENLKKYSEFIKLAGKYKTPEEFAKAYKNTWDNAWKAANK